MKKLRVGTRKSPLAMQQTKLVIQALKKKQPNIEIEIVGISTKGDRLQQAPLTCIGGKGVFVKEVEQQLLSKEIDFAVHSLKDVPALMPEGLVLAATPERANAFDCLIFRESACDLTQPLTIGTSSIRRAKQLGEVYPQMRFVPIRGKIETRLKKMQEQNLDGTVLACAGLERMNYFPILPAYQVLTPEICVPAIGQGILGVQCRQEDHELRSCLSHISHEETWLAAQAERYFLEMMNGNCEIPIGAYARKVDDQWFFSGYLAENFEAQGKQLTLVGHDPMTLAEEVKDLLL